MWLSIQLSLRDREKTPQVKGQYYCIQSIVKEKTQGPVIMTETLVLLLEPQYRGSGDSQPLQNILKLKYEYNTILLTQVSDWLLRLKQCNTINWQKSDLISISADLDLNVFL